MSIFFHASQLIKSKSTSLNQVAATFRKIPFESGTLNLDYGGGKYDKAQEILSSQGASNAVYDPFNRSLAHNLSTRLAIARNGGADTATVNNVLNVIAEAHAIAEAIEQTANGIREDGTAYFLIHEGDRTGLGKSTTKGWQRNQKASDYVCHVQERFSDVRRKGKLIIATGPRPSDKNLFDLKTVECEIIEISKSLGVPQPSSKHGCGKSIGGCLYLHKSQWKKLPAPLLALALSKIPDDAIPAIAKWDAKAQSLSLIESRGFNDEDEPAIQRAFKVSSDGTVSTTAEKHDPQIYHHKWNFVAPDYEGFDYHANAIRSISWAQFPCDRSKIGTRSFWEREVAEPLFALQKCLPNKTEKNRKLKNS